jgi:acyl-coenzyme A thioesterase PaaI-like protein
VLAPWLLGYSSEMDSSLTKRRSLQATVHPFCMVCSGSNPYGLALNFEAGPDGVLTASFHPNQGLEGYQGLLHGGMTASLLDGVMTNCLFSHGIVAVTGELRVRYREPVTIGAEVFLRAWVQKRHPPLYLLRAELKQEGCVRASASAKFMERNE